MTKILYFKVNKLEYQSSNSDRPCILHTTSYQLSYAQRNITNLLSNLYEELILRANQLHKNITSL
jgi:hypothetical protein